MKLKSEHDFYKDTVANYEKGITYCPKGSRNYHFYCSECPATHLCGLSKHLDGKARYELCKNKLKELNMKLKQSDRVKLTSKINTYPYFINIGDKGVIDSVINNVSKNVCVVRFDKISNVSIEVNSFDLELIETRFEYDQLVYDKDGVTHRFLMYTPDNKMLAMVSHNKQTLAELDYNNSVFCETFYATNPTVKSVKEMTIAEIEKELGYTIKVVSNV